MKKIVSSTLIVSVQLIVGGLFLFMLFSDNNEDNKVVVAENDNLNKSSDVVLELFESGQEIVPVNKNDNSLVDLISEEEKKAEEERLAREKAAKEEAERKKAEEEAQRKKAEEAARTNTIQVSANGYNSKPGAGFNVTTGNKTYSLSDNDFSIVATVVNCEANRNSKDDVLAVMSVILNRADRRGISPVAVVAQPGQFSCYTGSGSVVSESVSQVMRDALNGIRNNSFNSFGSYSSGVSNNYISEYGNRYY